jgi:hypothetical protein
MIRASALAALLVALPALAAPPDPAERCEAAKNRAAGRYAACLQDARARAVERGDPLDTARCEAKLAAAWQGAEARAARKGGSCPTEGDLADLDALIGAHGDTVGAALAGLGLPACGNATVDVPGEECDAADLHGRTCADFGFPAGALACDASCRFDLSACSRCPGTWVGGYCYWLGADGQSCDAVCAAQGWIYDEATRAHSGSDATDTACIVTLDALGAPSLSFELGTCGGGFGCIAAPDIGLGARVRCPEPTTGGASMAGVHRACACREAAGP